MNVIEYMEQWTGEYFDKVLQAARKTSCKYNKSILDKLACSCKANEVLLDDSSHVQEYVDAIFKTTSIEFNIIYFQGMRDCVAILKDLKVLI